MRKNSYQWSVISGQLDLQLAARTYLSVILSGAWHAFAPSAVEGPAVAFRDASLSKKWVPPVRGPHGQVLV
ncbi:MAG: hypothetical protein WAL45_13415, partial [Terracidiphilus sp.]